MRDRIADLQLKAAEILVTGSEASEPITNVKDYPPCFDSSKDYAQWLEHENGSKTPRRKDFPAEPNYCRDCSPAYQREMIKQGRCLFPLVRFQGVKDVDGDEELVGYTPKRFLPQTERGSYGHEVKYLGEGVYRASFYVTYNGSQQVRFIDRAAAQRFADQWGVEMPARS